MKAPSPHANEAAVNPNQGGRPVRINPLLTEPYAGHKQWLPPLHGLTGNYWEAEKERAEGV